MVQAYQALGRMAEKIWGEGQHPRPKLLGPASMGSGGESSYLISQIGPHIDIAAYHKYHGGRFDPDLPECTSRLSFYVHPENFARYCISNHPRGWSAGIHTMQATETFRRDEQNTQHNIVR